MPAIVAIVALVWGGGPDPSVVSKLQRGCRRSLAFGDRGYRYDAGFHSIALKSGSIAVYSMAGLDPDHRRIEQIQHPDMTNGEIFNENPFSFGLEMVTIGRKDHVRGTSWPPATCGSNCSKPPK